MSQLLSELTEEQALELLWSWDVWARDSQVVPPDDALGDISWSTWVILAGRGFGKTRTGAETIRKWACGPTPHSKGLYRRFALVAETAADARDVLVEGESGILACHPPAFRPYYEPSKRRLTWPNGAMATIYNATEPDQLRGPQHEAAWCDELAKWDYARETWEQLEFGLRLGPNPRAIVTTTPRPIPIVKELISAPDTIVTRGSTLDNRANLSDKFMTRIYNRFAGTRLGRQELEAEILDDLPGALWTRAMFDDHRVSIDKTSDLLKQMPDMLRVVVALDPSGTSGNEDDGDSVGIVVAGRGVDGRAYVMADRTCQLSPAGWGRRAVAAYHEFNADLVVGEKNFGGDMVRHVIHTADPKVAYKAVSASRGKVLRAEPVAALYEQGRVSHLGSFPELEDQACLISSDGYAGEGSPDRLDALVWALTELMLGERTFYDPDEYMRAMA